MKKINIYDYLFCFIVGGVYLYALSRAVIASTFIRIEPLPLYFIGLASILIFMVVMYNKYTRLAAVALVLLTAMYVFFLPGGVDERFPHFYDTFLMITGQMAYRPHLGRTVVWLLSLGLGFAVVVFMLVQFNFWVLGAVGAAIFIFTWGGGFLRDETSFLFFLAAFLLILARRTNKSVSMVLAAAPLVVVVVWLSNARVPDESDMFVRRYLDGDDGVITAVGDFIREVFSPTHFSFASTGFSGAGGRLGGPISPNNRHVMNVYTTSPRPIYLAGAISDTYTGYRWLPTLREGDINTHGLSPSEFEAWETMAALMRGAVHASASPTTHLAGLGLSTAETRRLHPRQFYTAGVIADLEIRYYPGDEYPLQTTDFTVVYYWHLYFPSEEIFVSQGRNRTGSVFMPPRAKRLFFDENSTDYTEYITITPLGDKQTPSLMTRGTEYRQVFLNVDTSMSFIEAILRRANAGVYEAYAAGAQEMPRFGADDSVSVVEFVGDDIVRTTRPLVRVRPYGILDLPAAPLSMEEFIGLFEAFASDRAAGLYVPSPTEFMRLLDSFSQEILAPYSREVREHFTYVPEIVPARVHELTAQIVEGQTSDFGRVMAIREFLLQFPYTMDTEPVPRDVCFVDWFLFETRRGYCTYFASAMAVMSRIAGVPSRYVEGFVVPPTDNPNDPVSVTNRMAHAWVEVYLEGFGWHIIEATPPYALILNRPGRTFAPGGTSPDDWIDMYSLQALQGLLEGFEIPRPQLPEFGGRGTPAEAHIYYEETHHEPIDRRVIFAAVGILAVLAALIFLTVRNLRENRRLRRIEALPPNEQAKIYFSGIMGIATYHAKAMKPFETELAYASHMGRRFAFRSDSIFFAEIIDLYYKAKYSPTKISPAEIELMKEAYEDMLALLREIKNKWVFMYLRIWRGVGEL